MKKRIGKLLVLIMIAVMSLQLVACGDNWTEETAKTYVEAAFGLICTGENPTDMEFDDLSNEDAAKEREEMLDEAIEAMGLADLGVSDETQQYVREVLDKAMKKASYDVGDATKTDKGYDVPVTIHPIDLFGGIDVEDIQNQVTEMATNGEIDITDTGALYDKLFEMMFGLIDTSLDDPVYGDDYQMTVDIIESDDSYEASDEAATEFGEHIFLVEDI